jgi:hypothetical protein
MEIGDAVADEDASGCRLVGELANEPRLPSAGLAGQQHEGALAFLRVRERGAQSRQLLRAPGEREPRRRHERPG